jgi:hypothetical protein
MDLSFKALLFRMVWYRIFMDRLRGAAMMLVYLQPVGKYYAVTVLLTNCHTYMYGSETSSFFNLQPPALLEYLRGWRWIEFMCFEFSNYNRSYYCCMRLYLSIY